MKWTKEQQAVIDNRNQNLLVSAAAGSGKTAVLTERILQLVMDRKHPVDIDKLVVVTFTRAAAAEMRERILNALQKAADDCFEKDGETFAYLQRQLSFIHNARITTIDSFCMEVVREHFVVLDIDPAFQMGEEGELTLLRADVMAQVLEEYYEAGEEDFLNFIDIYSSSRSDADVEQMITTLYQFAMSYPYPKEWVLNCVRDYESEAGNFEQTEWYGVLEKLIHSQLTTILKDIEECLTLIHESDGPWAYESAVLSDKVFVEAVLKADSYEERQKLFSCYSSEALSRKKQPEADEKKKAAVKSIRDDYKKLLKSMMEKYYSKTREEVEKDQNEVKKNVNVLAGLVISFMEAYSRAKREKNLVDFSDLEHFALEILVDRDEEGNTKPSAIATSMAEEIAYIMIDEYQDSNYVQEMILMSVSGGKGSENNVFMVGDVKQSIYKFRMAKPELFLEKYDSFPTMGEGENCKIILSKNFRSRKTILDVTNLVFEKIMIKELGGITYDRDSALYYGADYMGEDAPVEVMIADTSDSEDVGELDDDVNGKELEAEMAALRIQELIHQEFPVRDKKTGEMRPVKYSDIVILLRSIGTYGDTFERVLKSKGIPVRCPVKKGCFDSFEVKSILEFLSIIDNPRQDIPLVAVLENIFRFTDEEIAKIKIAGKKSSMYENIMSVDEIEFGLKKFKELLHKYRRKKTYLAIYDLINEILEDTGFEYFISAFPDGAVRRTNITMLKERAAIYQKGSYSGLFHFIRYIEKNEEYEIQEETISGAGEEHAVTIMSIHKSKGLEFPVVIAGAMGKRFNQEDASKKVVLHQTLGIGMDRYDNERGIKSSTLMKRCIAAQIIQENMAEELRVLYVAMTRAKEKLILTGNGKMEKKWSKFERLAEYGRMRAFHRNEILGASSFLDLLLMCLVEGEGHQGRKNLGYVIEVKTAQELAETLVEQGVCEQQGKELLTHWNPDQIYDSNLRNTIASSLAYRYQNREDVLLKAKISVSELKHQFMADEEEELEEKPFICPDEEEDLIPEFLSESREEQQFKGTARGNAYHRVFQLLDYGRDYKEKKDVVLFLNELMDRELLSIEERKCIRAENIFHFLQSDLGLRMKQAWSRGLLRREQQFVMGIPASMVKEDYTGEEIVLVQGIIDAYFEEDGEMCLLDYKTDAVSDMETLKRRYQAQLLYYGYALERISGKKVKSKLIYSVSLGKSMEI